jgi:hypothetical protein
LTNTAAQDQSARHRPRNLAGSWIIFHARRISGAQSYFIGRFIRNLTYREIVLHDGGFQLVYVKKKKERETNCCLPARRGKEKGKKRDESALYEAIPCTYVHILEKRKSDYSEEAIH